MVAAILYLALLEEEAEEEPAAAPPRLFVSGNIYSSFSPADRPTDRLTATDEILIAGGAVAAANSKSQGGREGGKPRGRAEQ